MANDKKKEEQVEVPAVLVPVRAKSFSFEQWAMLRNKPRTHWAGLRAHAKNLFPRTISAWDVTFSDY